MRETLIRVTGIEIKNDRLLVVAGYVDDDVIIMAESEEDLKRTTRQFIKEDEKI